MRVSSPRLVVRGIGRGQIEPTVRPEPKGTNRHDHPDCDHRHNLRFTRERHRGLAIYSRLTGLAFLAAFVGVTTGSSSSAIVLPFYAGVLIAWVWIAVTSVHLYRRTR